MAVLAYLYDDARVSERRRVEIDGTLRDADRIARDVLVDDLSNAGFRMVTFVDLSIGEEISLGMAGIGRHRARVVRRSGAFYGCEFLDPLRDADLHQALTAPRPEPVPLPVAEPLPTPPPLATMPPAEHVERAAHHDLPEKLPYPMRMRIVALVMLAGWGVIALLGGLIAWALGIL